MEREQRPMTQEELDVIYEARLKASQIVAKSYTDAMIAQIKAEAHRAGQEDMKRRAVEVANDVGSVYADGWRGSGPPEGFIAANNAKVEIARAIASLEVRDGDAAHLG